MDTPKQQVTWLESFPTDIWAYIAWYLPGEQLGRLMMTGATQLWLRLKTPHVVKSINLGRDYLIFKSFPTFLNEFPTLDELSIDRYNQDIWCTSLNLFPTGLRTLELKPTKKNCITKLFGAPGEITNLSQVLPHLEILSLGLFLLDYSWMTHSPPSLTKLRLLHWDGGVELPSSLIHFEATHVHLLESSPGSKLPPSLESFLVDGELRDISFALSLLPPSTRKLSVGYCDESIRGEVVFPKNLLELLPRTLTWFVVPNALQVNFAKNPELASLLPSTLTELRIVQNFPCSAWSLLPQKLRKLSFKPPKCLRIMVSNFYDREEICKVQSIPFQNLPRTITSLELFQSGDCQYCGRPEMLNQSYFPPQLTHLKIPDVQLSPESVKLLPSSLTYLEIGNFCERACEMLPVGLLTLISYCTLISPNLIKFLPKSLTSLQLSMSCDSSPWFDYATGNKVEAISKLQEYKIQEQCLSGCFDWNNSAPLPPTLTSVILKDAFKLGDSFLFHQKLPNLLELSSGESNFSDLCIPLLSRHLTTLNVVMSTKISGRSFPLLPRGLTFLDTGGYEIFNSDVQHLPRTLKTVYLMHAIHLTDLCVHDMTCLHVWKRFPWSTTRKLPLLHFPDSLILCGLYPAIIL